MNNYLPSAADFLPLQKGDSADRIDRPSLSYWQDVWQRLQQMNQLKHVAQKIAQLK